MRTVLQLTMLYYIKVLKKTSPIADVYRCFNPNLLSALVLPEASFCNSSICEIRFIQPAIFTWNQLVARFHGFELKRALGRNLSNLFEAQIYLIKVSAEKKCIISGQRLNILS